MLRSILLTFTTVVITSGCSSTDAGDTMAAATTTATTSGTEAGTGSTGVTGVTMTDPTSDGTTSVSSTGAPTTGPGDTSTGEPGTSTVGDTGTDPTTSTTSDATSAGESSTGAPLTTASSILEPKSGSMVTGTALFTDTGGGTVDLVITLANVQPPGTHALHIHEIPDCSAPDGNSTGNHWNPPPTMLGELGTVEIAQDGTGIFMKSDLWSIGTGADNDVVNHSIIIHADPGGGTRIACGVITKD